MNRVIDPSALFIMLAMIKIWQKAANEKFWKQSRPGLGPNMFLVHNLRAPLD
jgi:hypothetical protein